MNWRKMVIAKACEAGPRRITKQCCFAPKSENVRGLDAVSHEDYDEPVIVKDLGPLFWKIQAGIIRDWWRLVCSYKPNWRVPSIYKLARLQISFLPGFKYTRDSRTGWLLLWRRFRSLAVCLAVDMESSHPCMVVTGGRSSIQHECGLHVGLYEETSINIRCVSHAHALQ